MVATRPIRGNTGIAKEKEKGTKKNLSVRVRVGERPLRALVVAVVPFQDAVAAVAAVVFL